LCEPDSGHFDEVTTQADPSETDYRLNLHIYSDANTVKINLKNISPQLVDERGHRFPLVKVASDVRQLFLTGDVTGPTTVGGKKAPFWAPVVGLIMYGGGGFLLKKEVLLRVL